MKTIKKNIRMFRGNSYNLKINVKNYDNELDKIYFTVRDDNDVVKIAKNLTDGITKITDENAYQLFLFPEDTEELEVEEYKYDIEIRSGNYVATKVTGKFVLIEEQTRKEQEK